MRANPHHFKKIKNFLLIGGDTISSLQDTHMV